MENGCDGCCSAHPASSAATTKADARTRLPMRGFPFRPNNVVQTDQAGRGTADPGVFIIAACERHRRARPSRADGCWDRSGNDLAGAIFTLQEKNMRRPTFYELEYQIEFDIEQMPQHYCT